jgi:hypothetical protein
MLSAKTGPDLSNWLSALVSYLAVVKGKGRVIYITPMSPATSGLPTTYLITLVAA